MVTPPAEYGLVSGSFSPSLELTGGVTYFLGIGSTSSQVTWLGPPGPPTVSGDYYSGVHYPSGTTLWTDDSGLPVGAFDITGESADAPEPGTSAEVLGGIFILTLFQRVRRRS